MRLIPRRQRPYLRSHPFVVSVSAGIAVQGLVNLLFPSAESIATLAFSVAVYYLFNALWILGGFLTAAGLLRGWRGIEAGGATLLAGSTSVYFIAVVSVRGIESRTAIFVLFLALGYLLRVRHLVTSGYATGHDTVER